MAEPAGRQRREPLGELDHRPMREAGEHHVLELVELRGDRGADARIRVAEEIDPPRAHRVEIAAAVEIVEPRTLAARDRHERQRLVLLHLRARMPHGARLRSSQSALALGARPSDDVRSGGE